MAEVPKSAPRYQTPRSTRNSENSLDVHDLHNLSLSPAPQNINEQLAQEQHDTLPTTIASRYLTRANTERLYSNSDFPQQQQPPNSNSITSNERGDIRSTSGFVSNPRPEWKGYHQDFYASKWFMSIQILIILGTLAPTLFIFTLSTFGYADPFSKGLVKLVYRFFLASYLGAIFCNGFVGIFMSRIFR